ncbi:MAG: glycerol-3-phosphate dehydrogenase/oxidase [Gallionella sp.]|nr:glycerol-3-phosphate dehydrogenase/oxidase [Gallionella sp.]
MKREFLALQGQTFDLLVCGGGIYGAWTAYDAALRGLKVALVEQGDWAEATSSASSKLIHGGLRYLESYDFKLVKKALAERQCLLHIAPHRVWPLRFGVPVYSDSRVGTLRLKAGLTLYDHLADVPDERMRHRHFGRSEFSGRFPFLDMAGLEGGFTYGDAQTDDARLVLELVAGAMAQGAVCVNYARLVAWNEEHGKVSGATVQDMLGADRIEVRARQAVSTAGQWMAEDAAKRAWCRLSKGVHLVMPALQSSEALLMTAKSDGRVFFVIPWYGRTLLGATDTDYRGDLDRVTVEESDVEYLLAAANHFLKAAWMRQDVIGSYAGLRVMKQDDHVSPSAASRDWELKTVGSGLHHSVGGKITSAREDAACIVDVVTAALNIDAACSTGHRDSPWKPQQDFSAWLEENGARAQRLGIDAESAKWLLRRHGRRAEQVFRLVEERSQLAERIVPDLPFILADLLFCARDEMAVHLDDLLRRRLPLLILARLGEGDLRRLAGLVAPVLGWDAAAIAYEIEACRSGPCPR